MVGASKHWCVGDWIDAHADITRGAAELPADLLNQRPDIELRSSEVQAGVGAGQSKQVCNQPAHALGLAGDVMQGFETIAGFVLIVELEQLDIAANRGQ